jgi:uncharacterized membrane protein YhhN
VTALAWLAVGVAAPLEWWAVAVAARRRELVLKPLVLVLLLLGAVGSGATASAGGWWVLCALAFSLAGDVALLSDAEPRFLTGLTAFLLAHLAYVAAFAVLATPSGLGATLGAAVVLAGAVTVGRAVLPAAARAGGAALGGACAAYLVVIGAMVVAAWATGRPLVALGATIFMGSDAVLALDRFVRPVRHGRVVVMVTYHVGQVLIVLGVLR